MKKSALAFGRINEGRKLTKVSKNEYSLLDMKHAYTAGIIDGEGSITIQEYKGRYAGHISITSTTLSLLEWFKKEFNGNITVRKARPNRLTTYLWQLSGKNSLPLLLSIYPYLIVKKKHAKLYFDFYKDIITTDNRILDSATKVKRNNLIKEMHALTRRTTNEQNS